MQVPILGINMPNMGKITSIKRAAVANNRRRRTPDPRGSISIADALFSRTQQRVLGFLLGQTDRSFYASELIELTGSGSGAVQRELQNLVESGLVTSRDIGRQRHFQANPHAPIFDELRRIVVKTSGIAGPLRSALTPLSRQIEAALIYGSFAKGAAKANSDIDLLLVADGVTLQAVYEALESVERVLRRKVSPTLYMVAEFERRLRQGNPFLTKVLAGPTIPLLGDINAIRATR